MTLLPYSTCTILVMTGVAECDPWILGVQWLTVLTFRSCELKVSEVNEHIFFIAFSYSSMKITFGSTYYVLDMDWEFYVFFHIHYSHQPYEIYCANLLLEVTILTSDTATIVTKFNGPKYHLISWILKRNQIVLLCEKHCHVNN